MYTHLEDVEHSGSEDDLLPERQNKAKKRSLRYRIARTLGLGNKNHSNNGATNRSLVDAPTKGFALSSTNSTFPPASNERFGRTLQKYHGGPNEERTEYMEQHSALREKNLAVNVEQVSIFLLANNTVVSFFEHSAEDVEDPILTRLRSQETVLRRCSDASMIVQAIMDAIIDLAIPVTAAYKDSLDELELSVLTDPHVRNARSLYIILSEIVHFRYTMYPIINLVSSLRDHKEPSNGEQKQLEPDSRVTISPSTYTYLGDVEDHVVLLIDNLDQMRRSADNLIDLIFNTISTCCIHYYEFPMHV